MDGDAGTETPKPQKVEVPPPQEAPKLEDLEAKHPLQTTEYPNGKIAYRDMKPDVLRQGGDVPLVMMSGWGTNLKDIGNVSGEVYGEGQHVVTFDIEGGAKGG